jgi:hypothetical protein
MFGSLNNMLEHIKEVELETIELSKESLMKLSTFLEKNSIEIDDDVATALQYQDIISQQLSATIEAIEYVQGTLNVFKHAFDEDEKIASQSMGKLQDKLESALVKAKDRKSAFKGKLENTDEDEIEFF